MKRHEWKYPGLLGLVILLLTGMAACQSDSDVISSENSHRIQIYTSVPYNQTNLLPNGEKLTACLIFWRENRYKDKFSIDQTTNQIKADYDPSKWMEPYLVVKPEYEINYYRVINGTPFNTEHSYPLGDAKLHVMGYAPADGMTTQDNYCTIDIPKDMQNGKIDFLSGDGNDERVGSSSNRFEIGTNFEKQKKQLEFCHLTAKIRVEARRHENLYERIGVQNVKVSLKGQKVPKQLKWIPLQTTWTQDFPHGSGYQPIPTDQMIEPIVMRAPANAPILQSSNQLVDSCYVYAEGAHYHPKTEEQTPGATSGLILTLDVEAELMPWNGSGWDTQHVTKRKWENLSVTITNTTGDQLKMGHAYNILITFNVYDLRLQGQEIEWESGGKHYVPIIPVE